MHPPAHVPGHQPAASPQPTAIPLPPIHPWPRLTVARTVVARCDFAASGSVLRNPRNDVHRLMGVDRVSRVGDARWWAGWPVSTCTDRGG